MWKRFIGKEYRSQTRNEEIKAEREKYSQMLKKWFDKKGVIYHSISGDYLNRFDSAKKIIEEELKITTKF